jgi:hypothetical protein
MNSTCTICGKTFIARHSYGLCPLCCSKDRLREFDRLESTIRALRRRGVYPLTLTLIHWLSTISDFAGLCAFCREYTCNVIEMVSRDKGLVYDNVVPACRACSRRRQDGYEEAEDRVRWYLTSERVQHFIPSREEIEPA